jgi:hypothetical protein
MAQRKYKTEWSEQHHARESVATVASPTRILQRLLDERRGAMPETHVDRWSQRRALLFITISASMLWVAILVAGAQTASAIV